jgi:hypothetical protein
MAGTQLASKNVGWGISLLAGVGAGFVAAVASVAALYVLRASVPPRGPSAWSAFVAGILGGLVYALLSRVTSRPRAALWITTLGLATIISIVVATLPFPQGSVRFPIPIAGLLVPLRQVLALIGLGQFSDRRFPAAFLHVAIIQHYVTAVAVSLLVPRVARGR